MPTGTDIRNCVREVIEAGDQDFMLRDEPKWAATIAPMLREAIREPATLHLGYDQFRALEPYYDDGSPVSLEPIEDLPGNAISDLRVTYFKGRRGEIATIILTREGDEVLEENYEPRDD